MYVCIVITYSRVWINTVRLPILLVVSWTGKMNIPLSPCVPENLVSRDGFSRPVQRQPAHLHTQAKSGAYLRNPSRVPRRRPFMKPPYAIGPVPSLSGRAIAYRWRSLPRVRRHRASKSQGGFERLLPWQVTMDQLIFASLSHNRYWYEVGIRGTWCSRALSCLRCRRCPRSLRHWAEGASMAVPFFPNLLCPQQLSNCWGGFKKEVRGWGCSSPFSLSNASSVSEWVCPRYYPVIFPYSSRTLYYDSKHVRYLFPADIYFQGGFCS